MKLKQYLKEITLTRVFRHFQNKEIPVAIITAFRNTRTYKDNKSKNLVLASKIKNAGYGYVYVDGYWVETDEETGEKVDVREDSILIIGQKNDNGKMKGFLKKWIKEYNQEAVIFKNEGSYSIGLLDSSGNISIISDKFSLRKLEIVYTKLHGRGGRIFSFNEEREGKNWIGRMKDKILRENDYLFEVQEEDFK